MLGGFLLRERKMNLNSHQGCDIPQVERMGVSGPADKGREEVTLHTDKGSTPIGTKVRELSRQW